MLDRLTTSTHCIRISVQARLHGIDNILVLPPLDATLRSLRALSLQRAGTARVGPVVVQDQSIFLVREVVGELITVSSAGDPPLQRNPSSSPAIQQRNHSIGQV